MSKKENISNDDKNGDKIWNPGETWYDTGEPFYDDNQNRPHDAGESYIDLNRSGKRTLPFSITKVPPSQRTAYFAWSYVAAMEQYWGYAISLRERETAQAASTAREPQTQRSTPQRRQRSRQHLDTQRPRVRRIFLSLVSRSFFSLASWSSLSLASRSFRARLFEQFRRQAVERVRVFAQEFGCARERFGGARVEGREQRQELSAHAHAREALVLVHLVGAELYAALAAEAHGVRAPRP